MDWTHLLKELAAAVEVRNRRVASLRTAGSHVAELAAQALAAGAPGTPLRRILATMEPMVEHERRPHACGQSSVVPPGGPAPLPRQSTTAPAPPMARQPKSVNGASSNVPSPRYSLTEACEKKILPWTAPTARKYMRGHSPKRGILVPTGKLEGQATRYTEDELTTWLAAWQQQAGPTPGRPANEVEPVSR